MQQFIKDTYKRGGVTTISWHLNNPLTGKSAWDTDRFNSEEDYLLKYPGDEWVDIIGFDIYQLTDGKYEI